MQCFLVLIQPLSPRRFFQWLSTSPGSISIRSVVLQLPGVPASCNSQMLCSDTSIHSVSCLPMMKQALCSSNYWSISSLLWLCSLFGYAHHRSQPTVVAPSFLNLAMAGSYHFWGRKRGLGWSSFCILEDSEEEEQTSKYVSRLPDQHHQL